MRAVRIILGILLLTIGLPLLLAGAGLWTAMQHRDAGGAFSGDLEEIKTPGYAVVVPDVDGLLRRQAPFARAEQTRLRVTAQTGAGTAFIGLARPEDAARFLAGVAHTQIDDVKVTRGALPVRAIPVAGEAAPAGEPRGQRFWTQSGTGALEWSPASVRGRHLALIVMAADGQAAQNVAVTAEIRPGWLNSSTWGLLVLGSMLLLLGILFLGWPSRAREVVYVVDPSQVPDIAARLGVAVPSLPDARVPDRRAGADRGAADQGADPGADLEPVGGRPATLAESAAVEVAAETRCAPSASPPVVPRLAWPPVSAQVRPETSRDAVHVPGQVIHGSDRVIHVPAQGSPDTAQAESVVAASGAGPEPSGSEPSGAVPSGAVPSGAVPSGAVPSGAVPSGAEPSGAGQAGAEPSGAGQAGAEPSGAGQAGAAPSRHRQDDTPPVRGEPAGAAPEGTEDGPAQPVASSGLEPTAGPEWSQPVAAPPQQGALAPSQGGPGPSQGVPAPPPVVSARTRRRRANAGLEPGKGVGEPGDRRAGQSAGRGDGQPEAPTGAGIAAAVAAGRRPARPRTAAKAKPATNEADQPVA